MSRPILDRAQCLHCDAPLEKRFGKWVHHWIYANACRTPEADPDTIELDYGR